MQGGPLRRSGMWSDPKAIGEQFYNRAGLVGATAVYDDEVVKP